MVKGLNVTNRYLIATLHAVYIHYYSKVTSEFFDCYLKS